MSERKSIEVSEVEKMIWEKLKSYKNSEGNIFESQKTKVEVAERESRWCMIWEENWKMVANWRRGWLFRKENRKRGKKNQVNKHEERKELIPTDLPWLHSKWRIATDFTFVSLPWMVAECVLPTL